MNPKNIYRGPHFLVNSVSPSIFDVRHKVYRNEYTTEKESSFHRFQSRYFSEHHLGYLGVNIGEYAGEGNYDNAGGCICKIVDVSWPTLDIKKQLFCDIVKNIYYIPGQIIIELPSGETIPVFSTTPEIDKLDDFFRIFQIYSVQFIEALKEYRDHGYYHSHDSISLKLYMKTDQSHLAYDLRRFVEHRELQKSKQVLPSQTNNTTQKTVVTDAEILALWKTIC